MEILSPLTRLNNISLERKIPSQRIINIYKKNYGLDVSAYFKKVSDVSIYKCNETGYRFYYPFNLGGDSAFYEFLQEFDWYYMPWKWEHEIATSYLAPSFSVLEVGCAHGAFLEQIASLFPLNDVVGLELNESAVTKSDKFEIRNEFIESYAVNNKGAFDVVCSFEVLEHISEVFSFLKSQIDCLKQGGTLIISVPNNDSFIKGHKYGGLNLPPHHMGLWDQSSLRKLTTIFPIELINIHFEELQEYHVENYVYAEYYSSWPGILGKVLSRLHKILGIYQNRINRIRQERKQIIGHTILAAFKKI